VLLRTYYWVDKIKEMGRACAGMAKKRSTYSVLWGNLKERDRLEDLGVYERIILKWILRKQDATTWNGLALLWIATTGRLL
jgi:hypothetical protein